MLPRTDDPIAGRYTVNASAKGHRDGGYIGFKPSDTANEGRLCLMLVERDARMVFQKPHEWPEKWGTVSQRIGGQFTDFVENGKMSAACLLNLLEAIRLFPGGLLLAKLLAKGIPLKVATEQSREKREEGILQDRLLLLVDPEVKDLVVAQDKKGFKNESAAAHGKAKDDEVRPAVSLKETRFPDANLQFTFFEKKKDSKIVYADIDMDYMPDKLSHLLFEVFPNTLFGSRTDPRQIYALRWMASKNAQPIKDEKFRDEERFEEFAPPYFLAL